MDYLNQINQKIDEIKNIKDRVIIVIDGKAASGKTTLAEFIKSKYSATIIHMDDFFLPNNLKSDQRLKTPGGNIHYERFKEEVIDYFYQDINYKKYDCSTRTYQNRQVKNNQGIIIIEGSYSMHPYFGKYYDLSIFVDIDSILQKERIQKRNPNNSQDFFNKWIPYENNYIDCFKINLKADIIIEANNFKY